MGEQSWQAHEVVCGATEDEDPIDVMQSTQLHLADRAGLFQPSETLLDQPPATKADRVAWVPRGPAIKVRAASLFVLRHMCGTFSARAAVTKSLVS